MAKEKKNRSDKYEEKLSFEGSFEDLIRLTAKHAEMKKELKFKIGNIVNHEGVKCEILGTRLQPNGHVFKEGMDYVITGNIQVKESELK